MLRGSLAAAAAVFALGVQAQPIEVDSYSAPATPEGGLRNNSTPLTFVDNDPFILGGVRNTEYVQDLQTSPSKQAVGGMAVGKGALAMTAGVGAYAYVYDYYGAFTGPGTGPMLGLDLSTHHTMRLTFSRIKATKTVNVDVVLYTFNPLDPSDPNPLYYASQEVEVPSGGPGQSVSVDLPFLAVPENAEFNFAQVDGIFLETDVAAQVAGDGYVLTDTNFIDD